MHKSHVKNTVRYYVFIALALLFLFFTNDFGLIDVQKTAIVMAVGIDKEEDVFVVTSQIAVPQSSDKGKSTQAVQIVSRGNTIAEALEEINTKTGWYPKLVFCDLIILGKSMANTNAFDALDFFLRDEYMSDNCLVAVTEENAKTLLNTTALVDPSGSVAMQKILSPHAERVGTVLPSTLREFSIGYFSDSKSGYLPVIKAESAQDPQSQNNEKKEQNQGDTQNNASGGKAQNGKQNTQTQGAEKPLFSARKTALFKNGRWVETLNEEETFALSAMLNPLRLAAYSVDVADKTCTLTIKQNAPKISIKTDESGKVLLRMHITLSAGMMDFSASQGINHIADVGDVPNGSFEIAENKLSNEIRQVFEKSKNNGVDLFGVQERIIKYEKRNKKRFAKTALENTLPEINVTFRNIR